MCSAHFITTPKARHLRGLTLCFLSPHSWFLLGCPPARITRHDPPMEGRLRDTRRQSHAQTQAERCFEGFVVLRPLSLVRPKSSRCVSTMAHVSPLTSHLLSPRRLPLGRPPARAANHGHDVEGRGRDPGCPDSPPQTHVTRLQGIKRLLHTRLLSLRAQPPYHSPQHEAHLEMTRLAPNGLFRWIHAFFISQNPTGTFYPRRSEP